MEPDIDAICMEIRELQARRKFLIGTTTRLSNSTGAYVRLMLGFSAFDDEAARAKAVKRSNAIIAHVRDGKEIDDEDKEVADRIRFDILASFAAMEAPEKQRKAVELAMKQAVRKLPVIGFQKSVRGLGEVALAVVIGEAGNLAAYPNPAKLWKRLGLAPRDGKAMSSWRREGGLTADDWTAAGYAPKRLAQVFSTVSEPLFRSQTPVGGPYRLIYDARRARTAETQPDWTALHSHRDALRIMTKQLVLDLWSEWRRASAVVMPMDAVPAADLPDVAERRAEALSELAAMDADLLDVETEGRVWVDPSRWAGNDKMRRGAEENAERAEVRS